MAKKFRTLYRRPNELYQHFTCATDTKQVRIVLISVNDTILRKNLAYSWVFGPAGMHREIG